MAFWTVVLPPCLSWGEAGGRKRQSVAGTNILQLGFCQLICKWQGGQIGESNSPDGGTASHGQCGADFSFLWVSSSCSDINSDKSESANCLGKVRGLLFSVHVYKSCYFCWSVDISFVMFMWFTVNNFLQGPQRTDKQNTTKPVQNL